MAARHGITQIGRTTANTEKKAVTVQGEGEKTRQKDPKGEAEKAKRERNQDIDPNKEAVQERENPTTEQPKI